MGAVILDHDVLREPAVELRAEHSDHGCVVAFTVVAGGIDHDALPDPGVVDTVTARR